MKRTLLHVTAFGILVLACALTACSDGGDPADRAEVEQVFRDYKAAVLSNDGSAAVGLVTPDTLAIYQRFVDLALDADEQQSKAMPFVDKVSVLIARHRLAADELRALDGKGLFRIGIEREWTSPDSVRDIELSEIRFDGDVAWIDILSGDARQNKAFRLERIDGVWKLDLIHIVKLAVPAFKMMVEESGMSENDFVLLVAGLDGVRPVDEATIWQPVGR